jgi:hypothetical protein
MPLVIREPLRLRSNPADPEPSCEMKIQNATADYEAWLARHLTIAAADLRLKHQKMRDGLFPFLRATFYRWAQIWPEVCDSLASAPLVLAVGDLHVENFGTWRDLEGRLVWGINDFDEAWWLPYTNDLVRLAASANVAIEENHLKLDPEAAAGAILDGYSEGIASGGRPFVLAERQSALRSMALQRLKQPETFWEKLDRLPAVKTRIPAGAAKALRRALPRPDVPCRVVHRVAGLGSLGRQRFAALAEWQGGRIAREAKAMAPSACLWASRGNGSRKILYQEILDRAVRCPDAFVKLQGRWIVRRLAPDCSRIELAALPKERDERLLLRAMGFETANVHLGTGVAAAIQRDLRKRGSGWLHDAAAQMTRAVEKDWKAWRSAAAD